MLFCGKYTKKLANSKLECFDLDNFSTQSSLILLHQGISKFNQV